MRRIVLATLFFATISLAPAMASAGTFTLQLTQVYNGNVPDSTSPYLTFAFLDGADCQGGACAAGTVQLVLTSSLEDASEFVTEWDFNASVADPASLTIGGFTVLSGTVAAPSITTGSNHEQAAGDGLYDIAFFFQSGPPIARMDGTDQVRFTITGTGITAQTFNALSAPGGGGAGGPFTSAAHVQGITPSCSGWVSTSGPDTDGNSGTCGTTTVPDGGGTLSLLGLALAGIGGVRRYMV